MLNEVERAASGVGTIASGLGTAWSFATQAADLMFGLPIQVVLACFFSSAAARTYVGSVGLLKTAWIIIMCAALGAYTVPLALHLFGLPTTVQAGVGVLISGGIQIPAAREWIVNMVKAAWQLRSGAPAPVAPTPPTPAAGDRPKEIK